MEGLTRLVTESLARHGFDRPVDYRRLQWSRWFRCESHHSLLVVPSKPGVFALAEEMTRSSAQRQMPVGCAQPMRATRKRRSVPPSSRSSPRILRSRKPRSRKPPASPHARRHPVLRRRRHGLRPRPHVLARESHARAPRSPDATSSASSSSKTQTQRRSICNALNQWMVLRRKSHRHRLPLRQFAGTDQPPNTMPPIDSRGLSASWADRSAAADAWSSIRIRPRRIHLPAARTITVFTARRPALNSAVATNLHCSPRSLPASSGSLVRSKNASKVSR